MTKDLSEIEAFLRQLLLQQSPTLRMRKNEQALLEACGTKEAMQGKQKVDGFYFASVVAKPKDIRFYFFPLYTHAKEFKLSLALQKMLKGKTCFHIKSLDEALRAELSAVVNQAVKIYQEEGLI